MKETSGKSKLQNGSMMVVLVLLLSMVSCTRGMAGSLVILDPVLPVLAPEVAATIGRYGRSTITLPFDASGTLYSAIAAEKPAVLFLSPLLAPELDRILDSSPAIRLVYAGGTASAPREGLYSAVFSSADAAGMAGTILAGKDPTLPPDALCVAIFMNGSEEAIQRFTDSYLAAKPGNKPIIENIVTPWPTATVNRLKSLDIRQAYIAVPGKDAARWAREVLPGNSFVLMESAFGGLIDPAVDAMLVWDLDSSLKLLVNRLYASTSASISGIWRLLER
jgi:hypothetical protein